MGACEPQRALRRPRSRSAAEEVAGGAAVPSVYYHVPGKQAALDLLAESVLADIPVPAGTKTIDVAASAKA